MKCEVWNEKCEVLNEECEVLNEECEVLNEKCEVLNEKCEVLNEECEVGSVEWWDEECVFVLSACSKAQWQAGQLPPSSPTTSPTNVKRPRPSARYLCYVSDRVARFARNPCLLKRPTAKAVAGGIQAVVCGVQAIACAMRLDLWPMAGLSSTFHIPH